MPTAAVSKRGINFELLIHEEFWDNLSEEYKKGIIKHELLHVAFFHLFHAEHLPDREVFNIAADLEVNQYIHASNLPEDSIKLDSFNDLKLPPKAGLHEYYRIILEAYQQNKSQDLSNFINELKAGNQSMHGTWQELMDQLSDSDKELMKKQVEHQLKEAAENVEKNRGTLPGEMQEIINRLREVPEPKFDWRGYLRRFAGASQKITVKRTFRKLNRRFDENPGLKIKKKKRILVIVDTSGSVSNDELIEFFNEIHHMYKTGSEVFVVECDAHINHTFEYKGQLDIKLHGRGGTDFQPGIDYYNEHRKEFSCMIYLTDGECSSPTPAYGRMLWVLSSRSQKTDHLPGPTIQLN
jgi:predicted metal-dependent peptidase